MPPQGRSSNFLTKLERANHSILMILRIKYVGCATLVTMAKFHIGMDSNPRFHLNAFSVLCPLHCNLPRQYVLKVTGCAIIVQDCIFGDLLQ
jgi:hypothetical protein